MDWKNSSPERLETAIIEFKARLPGWWFQVGECQVSADASIGPTRESEHISLIPHDERFDSGFHVDLIQPATMAEALYEALADALDAIKEAENT